MKGPGNSAGDGLTMALGCKEELEGVLMEVWVLCNQLIGDTTINNTLTRCF